MPHLATFDHFDAAVAERFVATSADAGGLPGYLKIRFVEMTAGRLVAVLAVRDELLTPFKTLHGGVMAGLLDHVLRGVLYPPLPPGQWAAPPQVKPNHLGPPFPRARPRAQATVGGVGKSGPGVRV